MMSDQPPTILEAVRRLAAAQENAVIHQQLKDRGEKSFYNIKEAIKEAGWARDMLQEILDAR